MPDAVRPRRAAFSVADAITLLRLPLAAAFPVVEGTWPRVGLLVLAGITDLGDGWVARRFGGSRIGAVLDPVVDKLFMAVAFGVVLLSGALAWWEIAALLSRDIVLSIAFFLTLAHGRGTAVPARASGKIATLLQLLTLLAFLFAWQGLRPLAWLTAVAALYAIHDYNRPFFRKLQSRR